MDEVSDHILVNYVLPRMKLSSLGALFQTCHRFNSLSDNEILWQNKYLCESHVMIHPPTSYLEYYQLRALGKIPVILSEPQQVTTLGSIFVKPKVNRLELGQQIEKMLPPEVNGFFNFQLVDSYKRVTFSSPSYILVYPAYIRE